MLIPGQIISDHIKCGATKLTQLMSSFLTQTSRKA